MTVSALIRGIALLLLGLVLVMATRDVGHEGAEAVRSSILQSDSGGGALREDLAHCRDMGLAAAKSESCRSAWALSRKLFLGRSKDAAPHHPHDASEVTRPAKP